MSFFKASCVPVTEDKPETPGRPAPGGSLPWGLLPRGLAHFVNLSRSGLFAAVQGPESPRNYKMIGGQ